MDKKKEMFKPGDFVATFTGEIGLVVSRDFYNHIKGRLSQGHRPGHYFAPGCCANPDYLLQVPVLFEDGSFDVMRSLQVKRKSDPPSDIKARLEQLAESLS